MDRTVMIAIQEFKMNLKRKSYLFFAFALPTLLVIIAFLVSTQRQIGLFEFKSMQGSVQYFAFPSVISMVFSLAIFLSANYMLQGIAKEKENKILEILVSSVSFRQLLTGKILGLTGLGLIQFAAWVGAGTACIAFISPEIFAKAIESYFAFDIIILYFIFFILGYLLYASLLAAIGVLTDSKSEAQQIGNLFTGFLLIPSLSTLFITNNSGMVLYAKAISIFPLTAPIAAMITIFLGTITPQEIALSITLLVITIAVVIYSTAKLFRAETLMYGKKFSIRQLIKFVIKG